MPPPIRGEAAVSEDWKKRVDDDLKGMRQNQHELRGEINAMALQHQVNVAELKLEMTKGFDAMRAGTSVTTVILTILCTGIPACAAAVMSYLALTKK